MPVIIVIYVLVGLCLFDAARRPQAAWAEADKDKTFWVMWLVFSFLVFPAVVIVPVYLIGVVPQFSGPPRPGHPTDRFRK